MQAVEDDIPWGEILTATITYVMGKVRDLDLPAPERVNHDYLVFEALLLTPRVEPALLQTPGSRLDKLIAGLRPLLLEPEIQAAIDILHRDFAEPGSIGPRHVVMEVAGTPDDELQELLVEWVDRLLDAIERQTPYEAEA